MKRFILVLIFLMKTCQIASMEPEVRLSYDTFFELVDSFKDEHQKLEYLNNFANLLVVENDVFRVYVPFYRAYADYLEKVELIKMSNILSDDGAWERTVSSDDAIALILKNTATLKPLMCKDLNDYARRKGEISDAVSDWVHDESLLLSARSWCLSSDPDIKFIGQLVCMQSDSDIAFAKFVNKLKLLTHRLRSIRDSEAGQYFYINTFLARAETQPYVKDLFLQNLLNEWERISKLSFSAYKVLQSLDDHKDQQDRFGNLKINYEANRSQLSGFYKKMMSLLTKVKDKELLKYKNKATSSKKLVKLVQEKDKCLALYEFFKDYKEGNLPLDLPDIKVAQDGAVTSSGSEQESWLEGLVSQPKKIKGTQRRVLKKNQKRSTRKRKNDINSHSSSTDCSYSDPSSTDIEIEGKKNNDGLVVPPEVQIRVEEDGSYVVEENDLFILIEDAKNKIFTKIFTSDSQGRTKQLHQFFSTARPTDWVQAWYDNPRGAFENQGYRVFGTKKYTPDEQFDEIKILHSPAKAIWTNLAFRFAKEKLIESRREAGKKDYLFTLAGVNTDKKGIKSFGIFNYIVDSVSHELYHANF